MDGEAQPVLAYLLQGDLGIAAIFGNGDRRLIAVVVLPGDLCHHNVLRPVDVCRRVIGAVQHPHGHGILAVGIGGKADFRLIHPNLQRLALLLGDGCHAQAVKQQADTAVVRPLLLLQVVPDALEGQLGHRIIGQRLLIAILIAVGDVTHELVAQPVVPIAIGAVLLPGVVLPVQPMPNQTGPEILHAQSKEELVKFLAPEGAAEAHRDLIEGHVLNGDPVQPLVDFLNGQLTQLRLHAGEGHLVGHRQIHGDRRAVKLHLLQRHFVTFVSKEAHRRIALEHQLTGAESVPDICVICIVYLRDGKGIGSVIGPGFPFPQKQHVGAANGVFIAVGGVHQIVIPIDLHHIPHVGPGAGATVHFAGCQNAAHVIAPLRQVTQIFKGLGVALADNGGAGVVIKYPQNLPRVSVGGAFVCCSRGIVTGFLANPVQVGFQTLGGGFAAMSRHHLHRLRVHALCAGGNLCIHHVGSDIGQAVLGVSFAKGRCRREIEIYGYNPIAMQLLVVARGEHAHLGSAARCTGLVIPIQLIGQIGRQRRQNGVHIEAHVPCIQTGCPGARFFRFLHHFVGGVIRRHEQGALFLIALVDIVQRVADFLKSHAFNGYCKLSGAALLRNGYDLLLQLLISKQVHPIQMIGCRYAHHSREADALSHAVPLRCNNSHIVAKMAEIAHEKVFLLFRACLGGCYGNLASCACLHHLVLLRPHGYGQHGEQHDKAQGQAQ